MRYNVDYVDITGEVSFLKAIIAKYHDAAKAKNLLIVPCCGFDWYRQLWNSVACSEKSATLASPRTHS